MPSRIRNALIVAAATMSIGCSAFDPLVCTTEARAAITVEVLDSVTNAPVGEGATITATNGASVYSAITYDDYPGPYQLAHEKAGEFEVTVQKSGYARWSRDGVRVTRDECHVHTVQLTALLQPSE
ncbi:MAG TPA: carboxypeptidase-like regulatory domain-containing protein [Gemmatimonadaceae bacterium]|nr:carboxypeptidase-like regulatory domain-containing protein [Gemmatimonadaceae bacterium]